MEILLVNTGDKYDEWYVNNIAYMLNQTGFKYDSINVLREDRYEGVWNKLLLFEQFKKGPYLYFDLDIVLTQNVENLVRDNFTLLNAWWRKQLHTPLNSSVMSWKGDYSVFHKMFEQDPERYMLQYKGIDHFLYETDMLYETYNRVSTSYRYHGFKDEWPIVLFNQRYYLMRQEGPWSKYTLSE